MSQRDVVAELRAARIVTPREVRARIRMIAADAPGRERRQFAWRRTLVLAVPVAAAIAAAVVLTRPASHHVAARTTPAVAQGAATFSAHARGALEKAAPLAVPTTPKRVQTVSASLSLRVASISDGVRRAVGIATSLSGYAAAVHAQTEGAVGTADLTLKVPRLNAQAAVDRLSRLGSVESESLDLTDRQAGLNATGREIARLQAQLKALRAAHAPADRIARLVARIQSLQRGESATRNHAHFATISVHLATAAKTTRASHAGRDAEWAAVGAAILALLLLAFRFARRYREYRLLSRP